MLPPHLPPPLRVQYGKGKNDYGSKNNPVLLDTEGKGAGHISQNPLYYQHTEQTQQFEKVSDASAAGWLFTSARAAGPRLARHFAPTCVLLWAACARARACVCAQEYEMAKLKQDEQLDRIGHGVTRLGEIARNMNEEVRRCPRPRYMQGWLTLQWG